MRIDEREENRCFMRSPTLVKFYEKEPACILLQELRLILMRIDEREENRCFMRSPTLVKFYEKEPACILLQELRLILSPINLNDFSL
jgi:hypothetical protein